VKEKIVVGPYLASYLPMRGLSEVIGMIDDTVFKNIVRERRMVTPVRNLHYHYY
jgi:hypothetical protein